MKEKGGMQTIMKSLNPIIGILIGIINSVKMFFYQIWYITTWIPHLWEDRNCDYTYIYKILYTKLNFTYKHLSNSNWEVKYLKELQQAINCCERLWQEEYVDSALIRFELKYPDALTYEFNEDETSGNFYELKFKHTAEQKEDYENFMNGAKFQKKSDVELLGNLLRDYSEYWWD